jgi:transcriptional regulator with PAS, ATPase and Fis domain
MDLPEPVLEHLKTLYARSKFPASLFVKNDGTLSETAGCCERYGLGELRPGVSAADQVDFLMGMLPLDEQWFCLQRMLIHDFRVVDIHFVPGDGGDWVVLLDVTEEAEREKIVQQQSNELRLLQRSQQKMLGMLKATQDNFKAVFNQLNLTVVLLDEEGMVHFVSRSGLGILQKDAAAVTGCHWSEIIPLGDADANQLRQMLKDAGESHERLRVKIDLQQMSCRADGDSGQKPGRTKWFDIDVQQDPRAPEGRIVYFYDVSDLVDLRDMLQQKNRFRDMVGKSYAMRRVFERIKDVARFDATVLIEGETGTGKELAARAIHDSSGRRDGPYVVVNCAGLADSLINSQLFGHKKGSFTDATSDRKGVFEAANGGTIVLDEIGDIPMNTQTRILRALEQREIVRVGETEPRKVDIRIVAATNKHLEDEVEKGKFRLDLLYRIRIARVDLPPLRERREDIPLLVDLFVEQICLANEIELPRMERNALSALMVYGWPGNVRELRNAVEFALINSRDGVVRLGDLPREVTAVQSKATDSLSVRADERRQIEAALEASSGRKDRAAELLGISRATLYRRLKALALDDKF